tara:strand:- start:233 stop:841 length:609 start_codon:yes stop_codon:yes gene_type:complete
MSMSWQNTPGPFGKYPCEEGYDDDLVEYSLRSFEHGMNNWKRKILNFIKQQESTQPLIFPWIVIKDRLFKYSGTGEYLSDKYDLPLLYIDSDSKIVQQTFLGETTNKLNVITTNLCVVIDPDNPRYVILFIDDEHDYNDVINPILQNCKFVIVFSRSKPNDDQIPLVSVLSEFEYSDELCEGCNKEICSGCANCNCDGGCRC